MNIGREDCGNGTEVSGLPEYFGCLSKKLLTCHINIWLYDDMTNVVKIMKLLSDATRLRVLMLLTKRELCVCQIMGVLGISQPLVSRNLHLLDEAGFLRERKEGKLVFYSLSKDMDQANRSIVSLLKGLLKSDSILARDLTSLGECEEFQKKTGKCDMKTFSDFMKKKRKKIARETTGE
jgi:ArsR family transcriptional regulator, arsenate/arsenite/antimonite-responsive transcriptional repressor